MEDGGIRYRGKMYSSLSAAAVAAAKDLGLASKALNGNVFWGLSKPGGTGSDPISAMERAWARYTDVVQYAASGNAGVDRGKLRTLIGKHVETLSALSA